MGKDHPDNPEEIFVQLFAANERHLRAFVRSMGLPWTEVDDIIQVVSLVMWRKWDQFDVESDFMAWARVIARFEVLKARRTYARDRHVFQEDLMELLADESAESTEAQSHEDYREALASCMDRLPMKSRDLVQKAYQGNQSIKELAEVSGKSPTALYKVLNRIRKKLQGCIETQVEPTR